MRKAMVLDEGKFSTEANWRETVSHDESFKLFVNDQYIGTMTTTNSGDIIIVSSDHKVRLEEI